MFELHSEQRVRQDLDERIRRARQRRLASRARAARRTRRSPGTDPTL